MTTARLLITDAFREGNIIAIGTSPTEAELAEGLTRLNRYIEGVCGQELGENLWDWMAPQPQRTAPVAANWPQLPYPTSTDMMMYGYPMAEDASLAVSPFPPKNSRIVWGGVTMTIYFPESPDPGSRMAFVQGSGAGDSGQDGAVLTLNGNGRLIESATTVTLTNPAEPRQWLYREDVGDWAAVTPLTLDDECPFPSEFDDLWTCMLAMRLAPRYGKTTAPETQMAAGKQMAKLKARYRQAQNTTYGSENFPNSGQTYLPAGTWFW